MALFWELGSRDGKDMALGWRAAPQADLLTAFSLRTRGALRAPCTTCGPRHVLVFQIGQEGSALLAGF